MLQLLLLLLQLLTTTTVVTVEVVAFQARGMCIFKARDAKCGSPSTIERASATPRSGQGSRSREQRRDEQRSSAARLELTAVGDDDRGERAVLAVGAGALNLGDDVHTLDDAAEDDVLAIEPRSLDGGQEELRAVGVGTSVGHREEAGASVLLDEVLVLELGAVDRLATSSVA